MYSSPHLAIFLSFQNFVFFLLILMASADELSPSSRQSRSHVVVLDIPDDAIEDVTHILERLNFHRGWSSQIVSFPDRETATHTAERFGTSILRHSSSSSGQLSLSAFHYPTTERDVSLLITDRVDARGIVGDPSSQMPEDVMTGPGRLTVRDRLQLRRMASRQ